MFSSSVTVAVLLTLVLESGDLIPGGGGGSVSAIHHLMYVIHFLTNFLKSFKYKIMLKCPDWASPDPPQKVKVHGLGLP